MNIFKRIFRKPAIIFVSLWAKRAYEQGVQAALSRQRTLVEQGHDGACIVYLACNSFRPDHLVTYTRSQFRLEKRVYGVAARLLTMNTLKRGCYYHTPDRWGKDGISEKDREKRRQAFVKERLKLAHLI